MNKASLAELARDGRTKAVDKEGILFFQSDASDSACLVCFETISIILSSTDGREMAINEMHAGEFFGEVDAQRKHHHQRVWRARTPA